MASPRRGRVRKRELVLTAAVLRDAEHLDKLTNDLLVADAGLQRLSRRILRLQQRLRSLVDDKAWAAFLELEQAYSGRLGDAVDLMIVYGFNQGRRFQRSVNDADERKPEE